MLIAGGGFAGLTLAIALRQALGPSFSVLLADPGFGKDHTGDERASAIIAAARRLFEALGIWQEVAENAQPIVDMVVTDSRLDDAVRPVFLTFAGDVAPGEPLAHMLENRDLLVALEAKAQAVGVALRPIAVGKATRDDARVCATLADGSAISANLGVNPSLTITAQAERAMALWPNNGEADPRPALGAAYRRLAPVEPRHPAVPPSAPAALRLSVTGKAR